MADVILETRNLSKEFKGFTAVSDVNLQVERGHIHALIGPNGAGKTTCFNLITGFYTPTAGTVSYRGGDITGRKPHLIARQGIVRSFQKTNVLKSLTVFENILAGHYLEGLQSLLSTFFPGSAVRKTESALRDSAADIVHTMGLSKRMDAPAFLLSCGELRLLEVGLALAAKPSVLMLDEPAAGLNSQEAMVFGETLKTLRGSRVESILIVEHNMGLVMKVSDRLVVMNFGQKLAEGTPAQILANREVVEAYLGKAHA